MKLWDSVGYKPGNATEQWRIWHRLFHFLQFASSLKFLCLYLFCLLVQLFLLIVRRAPAITHATTSEKWMLEFVLLASVMPAVTFNVSLVLDLWSLFQEGFREHCCKSVDSFH